MDVVSAFASLFGLTINVKKLRLLSTAGQPVVGRFKSEAEAAEILSMALRRYYDDALVRYNLACYWCVMGRVEEARAMLETACEKDESLRELAETDEDLVGLR